MTLNIKTSKVILNTTSIIDNNEDLIQSDNLGNYYLVIICF